MGCNLRRIGIELKPSPCYILSVAYNKCSDSNRSQTAKQKEVSTDPPYRTDLINAAMGARRLTNKAVAERAGVGVMTVSKIRNGNPRVGYLTLKKVVEALGMTIAEVAEPRID